ncbi:SulP family inorganic anion transporter, partial [Anabaena sp. UHCC 0253]
SLTIFSDVEIRRIGEIPVGLPTLQIPTFTPSEITTMIIDGAMLGILGCIDTLLTAVIADSLTRTEHKSNKELIGQGIGNLISGLCGGLPGAGATMGTVVNIQTGAKTALSGLTRALILLIVVLWAAGLTQPIPMAVLAGIALKVGIDILDWSFLKRAHKVSLKGTLIMYGVLFLTVFVDLIVAVGVGVFIANILTIDRLSELQSQEVKTISDNDDAIVLNDEEKQLLDQANGRIVLFYLSGPMIFGVSKAIAREHLAMADSDVLIVDLSDVPMLGITASLAIENAIKDASEQGRDVLIVGASAKVKRRLDKFEISRFVPEHYMFLTRVEALRQGVSLVDFKATSANVSGVSAYTESYE